MLCQVKYSVVLFSIISMTLQNLVVASYQHCVNETVSVKPNSSGTIEYQHANRGNLDSCTLSLTGFRPGSHISLPSVQDPKITPCQPNIIINNQSYCVKEKTDSPAIIQTDGMLTIKWNISDSNPFTFHYYSNVVECGQEAVISDVSEVSQLSGVLASRYDLSGTISGQCQINIRVVGWQQFTAQFQNLFSGEQVKLGNTTLGGEKRDTVTVSSDDGKITLTAFAQSYSFLIKFSVLHCGSVPQVDNIITPPDRLGLVGSHVTYSCVEGYRLNDTTQSTRTCDREDGNNTGGKWSTGDGISCVPVVCDLGPGYRTIDKGNAAEAKQQYDYNEEYKYNCDPGYSPVVVKCVDEGNWSAEPNCTAELCPNPPNIADADLLTQTLWVINSTAVYQCKKGFSKTDGDAVLHCTTDGGRNEWAGSMLTCKRSVPLELCPNPPNIANADLLTQTQWVINSKAVYHCKKGFTQIAGDKTLYCTANGGGMEWAGSKLTCKGSVTIDVMVGVTVSVGLVFIIISIALTAVYFKRYSASRRNDREGNRDTEMAGISPGVHNHTVPPHPSAQLPSSSSDSAYANLTAPAEYESLQIRSGAEREYEQLQ